MQRRVAFGVGYVEIGTFLHEIGRNFDVTMHDCRSSNENERVG